MVDEQAYRVATQIRADDRLVKRAVLRLEQAVTRQGFFIREKCVFSSAALLVRQMRAISRSQTPQSRFRMSAICTTPASGEWQEENIIHISWSLSAGAEGLLRRSGAVRTRSRCARVLGVLLEGVLAWVRSLPGS
jgi:hypothetical protein